MRLAKNMAIYAGADLLGRSIGLLTSPITTHLLTPKQYGASPLLAAVWALVALAQFGGMDWAYPFFRAQDTEERNRGKILATASFVATVSALTIWAAFFLVASVGPWLEGYAAVDKRELVLFLLGLGPATLTGWYLYALRFMHQALPYARVILLGRVASVVAGLPLLMVVVQKERLAVMFAVSFVVQLFAWGWALWELRRVGAWPYMWNLFEPDLARKMLRYGFFLIPGGLVYSASAVADRLLVGWFSGPEEVAILALSISLGSSVLMMKNWLALVWDPQLVEWISTKDSQIYRPKLQAGFLGLSAIFFSLTCLSAVWSDWIIHLLYPSFYARTIRLVPILIFAGSCSVLSLVAVATTMIANSPKYHLPIYAGGLLINLVVGVSTIPKVGALGAVLGTAASEVFILFAWGLLGRVVLKNLFLDWSVPSVLGAFSIIFVAFYQPGMLLQSQAMLERLGVTTLLLASASYLLWSYRPSNGWRRAFA